MLYRFGHLVFAIIYRVFYRRRLHGRAHIPEKGPLIICANHISWQDPAAIGSAFPPSLKIKFMAKKELFKNPIVGYFLRCAGAFPVDRDAADYGAIRRTFQILEEGGIIGLFPEGTRGQPGRLQKAQKGAALIAGRSGAPLLPVLVLGPYERGRPLDIFCGPVFRIPPLEYSSRAEKKALLDEGSAIIMENLERLIPDDRKS